MEKQDIGSEKNRTSLKARTQAQNPVVFEIVVPWKEVQETYKKRLAGVAIQVEIKGFRKGKAPVNLIEEKVGKSKLYNEVIQAVLPTAYQNEIKKRNLLPMISPRVQPINIKENEDWRFELTVAVKPEVKLEEYQKEIKEAVGANKKEAEQKNSDSKKRQRQPANMEAEKNRKMRTAFDVLLKIAKVDLPQMLVDEEVNVRLTKLIDQVGSLGMTIEQYLRVKNLSHTKIRQDYENSARDMLKLNLILDKIATDRKFGGQDRISKAVEWLILLG